jgi:hypothetical protein
MPNPTRDTTAGQIYNDLRKLARGSGRPTDEIMVNYLLERFLFRVANSALGREHFVLKGGLLLARFGARRMTRDIDLLGRHFPGEENEILRRISAIASVHIDDGVIFDGGAIKSIPIRESDEYHGVRLTMAASIARARLKLQLDISFGDPVTPEPELIAYSQQLTDETFLLLGYPIATVIAEKLTTAVSLGGLNTRDRDYADLCRLLTLHELEADTLKVALIATASHRGIRLRQLGPLLAGFADLRQSSYTAWLRRQGSAAGGYPTRFSTVVELVTTFADPLLADSASGQIWSPKALTWT